MPNFLPGGFFSRGAQRVPGLWRQNLYPRWGTRKIFLSNVDSLYTVRKEILCWLKVSLEPISENEVGKSSEAQNTVGYPLTSVSLDVITVGLWLYDPKQQTFSSGLKQNIIESGQHHWFSHPQIFVHDFTDNFEWFDFFSFFLFYDFLWAPCVPINPENWRPVSAKKRKDS